MIVMMVAIVVPAWRVGSEYGASWIDDWGEYIGERLWRFNIVVVGCGLARFGFHLVS